MRSPSAGRGVDQAASAVSKDLADPVYAATFACAVAGGLPLTHFGDIINSLTSELDGVESNGHSGSALNLAIDRIPYPQNRPGIAAAIAVMERFVAPVKLGEPFSVDAPEPDRARSGNHAAGCDSAASWPQRQILAFNSGPPKG